MNLSLYTHKIAAANVRLHCYIRFVILKFWESYFTLVSLCRVEWPYRFSDAFLLSEIQQPDHLLNIITHCVFVSYMLARLMSPTDCMSNTVKTFRHTENNSLTYTKTGIIYFITFLTIHFLYFCQSCCQLYNCYFVFTFVHR